MKIWNELAEVIVLGVGSLPRWQGCVFDRVVKVEVGSQLWAATVPGSVGGIIVFNERDDFR